MTRSIAAAALLGLIVGGAGFTLPAAAESIASCRTETIQLADGTRVDPIEANADLYVTRLRRLGYDVDSVSDWGGCVKAFINDPGGSSHMAFFDPDTLEPLTK